MRRGFTMVELLVVIAIISLLAAMLLPVLGEARYQAQDAACRSQLRQAGIAASLYADDFAGYFPQAYTNGVLFDGTNTFYGWNHGVPSPNWVWYTWGMLSNLRYFSDRRALLCPTLADKNGSLVARWFNDLQKSPSGLRTYSSYSIWGLSIYPNDVTHLCRLEQLRQRQPAPISDIIVWSGYWLSGAMPPTTWTHRHEKVNLWLCDASVRSISVATLIANAPFGGMNPLCNTYAWIDGRPGEGGGYNGGPAIAFWERVRVWYNTGQ